MSMLPENMLRLMMDNLVRDGAAVRDGEGYKLAPITIDDILQSVEAKKSQISKKEMTVENIILYQMAGDINQWLHQKGEAIGDYQIYLDRVCDIKEVLKGAIEKAKDSLSKYDPETSTVTIVDFPKGIKCSQNTSALQFVEAKKSLIERASPEVQSVIRDMVDIINSDEADDDEKHAALVTLDEAIGLLPLDF